MLLTHKTSLDVVSYEVLHTGPSDFYFQVLKGFLDSGVASEGVVMMFSYVFIFLFQGQCFNIVDKEGWG